MGASKNRRGGATQQQITAWAKKANEMMTIPDEGTRKRLITSWCMDEKNIHAPLCKLGGGRKKRKSKRKKSKRKKRKKQGTKKNYLT